MGHSGDSNSDICPSSKFPLLNSLFRRKILEPLDVIFNGERPDSEACVFTSTWNSKYLHISKIRWLLKHDFVKILCSIIETQPTPKI